MLVGSANASQSSQGALDEAALLTNDDKTVKLVKRWFADRMLEPVTPEWLNYCKHIYRPPRGAFRKEAQREPGRRPHARRLWVLGIRETTFPETERSIYETAQREANVAFEIAELLR